MRACTGPGPHERDTEAVPTSEMSTAAMTLSLFWMAAAAVVAPLLARLARGRAPEVVVLLLLGVLIGPHVLGLASTAGIEMIKQLGMASSSCSPAWRSS